MIRVTLEPAYVLHHWPYRDSSRLVELLGVEHGRLGVVARGARGPRSAWRAVLQPFRPLFASWVTRGELGTLTAAEPRGAAHDLPPRRLLSAYYLNELLLRLLPRDDPHPDLFAVYAETLAELASTRAQEPALRQFEKHMLDTLGYGLNLNHDAATGEPLREDRYYLYRLESGPVSVDVAEGPMVFPGSSLLALGSGSLHRGRAERDARRLLRAALEIYLGAAPLKTRELLRATRQKLAAERPE